MMAILSCITTEHNLWVVVLAAIMCLSGSAVTLRLQPRSFSTKGTQKIGWQFLTAITAGCTIWSTHFIAMMGHQPTLNISFDPVLTIISLIIVVTGAYVGIALSGIKNNRIFHATGGAIFGLSIAAMHYTGMFAYKIVGLVEWNQFYILVSIGIAVIFSALSFTITAKNIEDNKHFLSALAALVTAIVGLHFTGMTAFKVSPLTVNVSEIDFLAKQALALSIAGVAVLILGTSISSYLIDRSLRTDSHAELRKMALHDSLTGLPNRTSFGEKLHQMIEEAKENKHKVAIICIDLNRFKEVNDSRGHSAGDQMLKILAGRMLSMTTEGEHVARLGGDEFAAIKSFNDEKELEAFCIRLQEVFDKPMLLTGLETIAGASIGLAQYPTVGTETELLVNNADLAMFHAKSNFLETICFYDEKIGNVVRERRHLADALQNAISEGGLSVNYQRQTSLIDGEICGYEALLRWNHPERGNIPPSDFIPIAEDNGLIITLGEWVLRQACSDAVSWLPMTKVAVNISAVQLMDPQLPRQIHQILIDTGLAPHRLELELTETAVIKDKTRSLHTIRQIKALGVGIALDDFGSGYSSLDTLRTFPFDKIKLDRTFIDGVKHDKQTKAIIRAVLALGRSLDIPVLAEGIETLEQMELLQAEGCNEGQGYLLGYPASLDELTAEAGESTITQSISNSETSSEKSSDQSKLLTAEQIRTTG
ncbi:MAG: bifunctional diguanylate cyclase/phosphodiesterase [Rhodomicrobium sp.]|nr:MAG: bifunctional diguanylate cyclase/phosphodiesterase [Rhodomicrobium sp.]